MTENATSAFLGNPYTWSKVKIELNDVQPLHGGVRVLLPGYTVGQAFVTQFSSGGNEKKYRISMKFREKDEICQLLVEQDFFNIESSKRPGIPDEARPTITVTNRAGETHTVAKWAGDTESRFETIYNTLLQIAERAKGKRPIPKQFSAFQKTLVIAGMILVILAGIFLSYRVGSVIAGIWWPESAGRLAGLIILLIAGLIPAIFGLSWRDRKRPRRDRMLGEPIFLLLLNLFFFVGLVTLPTLAWRTGLLLWGETAVAQIQTIDSTRSNDEDAGWLGRYTIIYTFELNPGQVIERKATINQEYVAELSPNDEITATYLPILPRASQPSQNLLDDDYAAIFLASTFAVYLLLIGASLGGPKIIRIIDERF